jgi:hypothetical protein
MRKTTNYRKLIASAVAVLALLGTTVATAAPAAAATFSVSRVNGI